MLHSQETKYLTSEKYEENCILNSRYTLKKKAKGQFTGENKMYKNEQKTRQEQDHVLIGLMESF